jgi:hypothetical protein
LADVGIATPAGEENPVAKKKARKKKKSKSKPGAAETKPAAAAPSANESTGT